MSFTEKDFREMMRRFPTGVAIVTTLYQNKPVGITINTLASVSLAPPLVLFCLGKTRVLFPAFFDSAYFAIHVLPADQYTLSDAFAQPFANPWEGMDYELSSTGCPLIPNTLGILHCRRDKRFNGGDHVIFLNHIENIQWGEDKHPLIYHQGAYGLPLEQAIQADIPV
jgi:flavin reductase (DIM6/NTAB) family NADH-FMN oxidoreductase RutF